MEKNKILQASLLDIVFDNRNKVYGAYELRSKYSGRLSKALLITGAIASVVLFASFIGATLKPKERSTPLAIRETVTSVLKDDPIVDPPPPIHKPITQPPVATIRFTPPRIVREEEIKPDEEMKDLSELENTKIGTANVDGIKGNDIVKPPIEEGWRNYRT